jgi:hypothetical protein
MSNYEKIKKYLRDSERLIYWYDSHGKLLIVDSSKSESRKKLLKKNYTGELFRLAITFHTGLVVGQGGPLAVRCRHFYINNKIIHKIPNDKDSDKNGIIWFRKEWLDLKRKGWSDEWLEIIIDKIKKKSFRFGLGIHHFDNL